MISVLPDVPLIWEPISKSFEQDGVNYIGQSDLQRTGIATGASST